MWIKKNIKKTYQSHLKMYKQKQTKNCNKKEVKFGMWCASLIAGDHNERKLWIYYKKKIWTKILPKINLHFGPLQAFWRAHAAAALAANSFRKTNSSPADWPSDSYWYDCYYYDLCNLNCSSANWRSEELNAVWYFGGSLYYGGCGVGGCRTDRFGSVFL